MLPRTLTEADYAAEDARGAPDDLRGRYMRILTIACSMCPEGCACEPWIRWAFQRALEPRHARNLAEYQQRMKDKAKRAKEEARAIPPALKAELIADYYCEYCGGDADCVDHVLPVAHGGTRRRSNLVAACSNCNLEKSDMTVTEWREAREAAGLPWPPRSPYLQIVDWIIDCATAGSMPVRPPVLGLRLASFQQAVDA